MPSLSSEQGGLCRLEQTVTNTWPRWCLACTRASKLRAYLDTCPWFTPVKRNSQPTGKEFRIPNNSGFQGCVCGGGLKEIEERRKCA